MKRLLASLLCATTLSLASPSIAADSPAALDAAIEKYIMEHPDVLMKSLRKYQGRDKISDSQRKLLEKSEGSPVLGNVNGDMTMIVFFDYHCGYCKRFYPVIASLLEEDKQLRVIFKELPILSEDSEVAARAALAVYFIDKDKYFPFHTALMKTNGKFDMEKMVSLAKQAGISEDELTKGMKSERVTKEVTGTRDLAQELDISGTPAVIVGQHMVPGAASLEAIKAKIEAARSEAKSKKG